VMLNDRYLSLQNAWRSLLPCPPSAPDEAMWINSAKQHATF